MPQEIEITEELDNRLIITTTHGEGRDFELINGVEVEVAKPKLFHNYVAGMIYNLLCWFILKNKLTDRVIVDGVTLCIDEVNHFDPDLILISDDADANIGCYYGVPELVVEVASPSTTRQDLNEKREMYAKHGIPEYCTIQPLEKRITVWYNEDGKFNVNGVYQLPPVSRFIKPNDPDYITKIETRYYGDRLTLDLEDIFTWVK
ncbi:MAG: Uma2 family endonuclease [Oscillospiraceae bacterium]|jgi:Uma2 family endonuclease|nr:Uma2 family endonuclease [Oscillospiraceae bacterium]